MDGVHLLRHPATALDVSGYAILYGAPALLICERLQAGMDGRGLLKAAAATLLASCVFEIVGIETDVYGYFGAHALRVFGYPLVVGVLETAQVVCLAMAATALRRRLGDGWASLSLFLLFPMVFYGVNFGLGAPVLVAIDMPEVDMRLVTAATLFSIASAVAVVVGLSRLLPAAATPGVRATSRRSPGRLSLQRPARPG